jgi:hypothetical protein
VSGRWLPQSSLFFDRESAREQSVEWLQLPAA